MEKNLKEQLEDLYKLYPQLIDVAVVPVGITKYRDNLSQIRDF